MVFGLVTIVLVGGWAWFQFWKRRYLGAKRPWSETTKAERLYLSLAVGTSIQLLLITMIPGWIVTAMIVGKGGDFFNSPFGGEVWGLIMVVFNTIMYGGLTYRALVWWQPEVELDIRN